MKRSSICPYARYTEESEIASFDAIMEELKREIRELDGGDARAEGI